MALTTVGDLALSYIFRSRNSQVKADITRLTEEVATGQVASLADRLNGNFSTISSVEHSLTQLAAYESSITEASGFASAVQDSLEAVRETAGTLSADLLTFSNSENGTISSALGTASMDAFDLAISRLNMQFGGRSLFAGVATNSSALADANTILEELETAVSGETTATGVASVIDAWFASPAGFETIAYSGSAKALSPMSIGVGQTVSLDVTASDTAVRETLKGLAMAVLIDRLPLSNSPAEQMTMAGLAGQTLLNSNVSMLEVQAKVGVVQESLETASTRNTSETAAMELALSELISVDQYDAAAALTQAETQLELLYALTARTASLKLSDYI
ncbi:flagellin [Tropicimonas marinistellae]|uniref:flagellin n=1 Tax=Tropicimonas marinistellae TaxID=1739787 RepID=UPI00082A6094|nr:flagellin [Tropicimonas marinistellae]